MERKIIISLHWQNKKTPVALVFRRNTFEETLIKFKETVQRPTLGREEAIELIIELSHPLDIFVASTGMIGRELYEVEN